MGGVCSLGKSPKIRFFYDPFLNCSPVYSGLPHYLVHHLEEALKSLTVVDTEDMIDQRILEGCPSEPHHHPDVGPGPGLPNCPMQLGP